jgi:hypothetical protein
MHAYRNLGLMLSFLIIVIVVVVIIIIIIIIIIISKASSGLVNVPTEILYKPNVLPCKGTDRTVWCRSNLVDLGSVDCCLKSLLSILL